jgi:hypothetical protein
MGEPTFSPDGRFMAGLKSGQRASLFWVLDSRTGRILRRKNVAPLDDYEIVWRRGGFEVKEAFKNRVLARLAPR